MDNTYKVLWIEDETVLGLMERTTHLEMVEDFDLQIVETASEAETVILEQGDTFDAIIVDIRLNPGHDPKWVKIYNRPEERLGIHLIKIIFKERPYLVDKIGITTIERWKDIEPLFEEHEKVDPSVQYYSKVASKDHEEFEQFIRRIIENT